jgi:hypothetical protein
MPKKHPPEVHDAVLALVWSGLTYGETARRLGLPSRLAVAGIVWRAKHPHVSKRREVNGHGGPMWYRNVGCWIEQEMSDRIEAQRLPGQNMSQTLRDILAAGLDVMENDDA